MFLIPAMQLRRRSCGSPVTYTPTLIRTPRILSPRGPPLRHQSPTFSLLFPTSSQSTSSEPILPLPTSSQPTTPGLNSPLAALNISSQPFFFLQSPSSQTRRSSQKVKRAFFGNRYVSQPSQQTSSASLTVMLYWHNVC